MKRNLLLVFVIIVSSVYSSTYLIKGNTTWLYQFELSQGYTNKYNFHVNEDTFNNSHTFYIFYEKNGFWELMGTLDYGYSTMYSPDGGAVYFKNGYRVAVSVMESGKPKEIVFNKKRWKVEDSKKE